MTISAQMELLESLAVVDAELAEINSQLDAERGELSSKRSQLSELSERVERGMQSIEAMEKTRGELMAEVRQMSIQVEKSREKLARCRTEREANAAQREVEELRKLYRDREIEIEKIASLAEQARLEMESTRTERDRLKAELGESEGAVETNLSDLSERGSTREQARKELAAKVDPAILRRYDMVRKRRGSGLARAENGSCSQCHMQLPPMLFQQVMQAQQLQQCPSCNRILYHKAESPAAQDTQAG